MSYFENVLAAWVVLTILMTIVWLIHLKMKNAGVVDVFWGIGIVIFVFVVIGLLNNFHFRAMLFGAMIAIWGLRLSWYILRRVIREKHEDSRYQAMRQAWKTNLSFKFFLFFQFQVILQVILAAPFLAVLKNSNPQIQIIEWLGVLIWIVGIVGETLSDRQLAFFKSNTASKGKVCDIGLWQYSRHPNYFFEWVIWVGLFVFALGSPGGWVSVIAPALMLFLLLKVSGVPLAEAQSLKSRGELYKAYQKTTSVFIPLPKRK